MILPLPPTRGSAWGGGGCGGDGGGGSGDDNYGDYDAYDSDDDDFNDFPRDRGAHHFDVDTSASTQRHSNDNRHSADNRSCSHGSLPFTRNGNSTEEAAMVPAVVTIGATIPVVAITVSVTKDGRRDGGGWDSFDREALRYDTHYGTGNSAAEEASPRIHNIGARSMPTLMELTSIL